MIKGILTEEVRHRLALAFVWVGWLGAFLLLMVSILVWDDVTNRPAWIGLVIVFLLGVAVAASAALGRMRLYNTLTNVFHSGMDAQDKRDDDRRDGYDR